MHRLAAVCCLAAVLSGCGSATRRPTIFDCTQEDCEDCAVLSVKLDWSSTTLAQCRTCQGAAQGTERACINFPVRDGKSVVRGCNHDGDCASLSNFCGHYTGQPHNTCVVADAK